MFHQDWTPVVFKKPVVVKETANKTDTTKQKYNSTARKLEGDLDITIQDNVPIAHLNILEPNDRKDMIARRIEKKMNQTQLAKLINEQVAVINNLENGKVVNNPNVLQKINKILGSKLKFPK
jgi:putative transcription factor